MRPSRKQALGDLVRLHIALGGAQGIGLRLAAPLGQRLREVCEQHGQPEDDGDRQNEAGLLIGYAEKGEQKQSRRKDRRDKHHEHDRVFHLILGVQLHERFANGSTRLRFRIVLFQCGSCH